MTDARRLLILHDSPAFGGHELMFLKLLPALLAAPDFNDVLLCFPEGNRRFAEALAPFAGGKLRLAPWGWAKRPAAPYLGGFRRGFVRAIQHIVAIERPDAVLLLQGRIENCVVPTLALPRDLHLVGYIPMAHLLRDMGRNGLGDIARRRLYRRPDRFVVPSHAVATQIAQAGGRHPAIVVENWVTPPPAPTRADVRARLDLPADRPVALFLGRLEARQKGLDLLAEAMRRQSGGLRKWTFVFVGDGPDRALIDSLAATPGLDIRAPGWSDAGTDYLAAADVLLMPSRWEGVPLVMLEAMDYGVPLLTSDIDVFREYLPDICRMDFAKDDLAAALDHLLAPEARTAFHQSVRNRPKADAETGGAALLEALRG
ncbi:glycosyltransferase family 4 protein [Sphingomonas montanisoli]|uniref:Glycosyltransferase family 4 protein n=1 Tax=Sphingomonas montanisoli TaxID=2606412 RepID=A0A5D9C788_9SPHN|nr:glycosyltransferase family 4 protein [Sphingomonas montanisoli]TZG25841.1 glycosyltransferase family 4 protein [Sphingomonas montanisoli]